MARGRRWKSSGDRIGAEPLERRRLMSAAADLADFHFTDATNPSGNVYADAGGDLFGVGSGGPTLDDYSVAAIWELPAGTSTVRIIARFDAGQPAVNGGIVGDAAGNLYGTFDGTRASLQTAETQGGIWQYTAGTGSITTRAMFDGVDGDDPRDTTPAVDAAGNLFGITQAGGAEGYGVVYELPAGSATIDVLASFGGPAGRLPEGRVTLAADGSLYGTATQSDATLGTVWELPRGRVDPDAAGQLRPR